MKDSVPEIPADATEGVRALLLTVEKGRTSPLPGLVRALTDAERRACLEPLRRLRKRSRENWDGGDLMPALRAAGAGCCTGAAAAAQWLAGSDMRRWSGSSPALVLEMLEDRDPAWLGEVTRRLADRPSVVLDEYPLIAELVRRSGCPVPTTDGFVLGWVTDRDPAVYATRSDPGRGARSRGRRGPLVDRLRDDPFLPVLVPRLFEAPGTGSVIDWSSGDDPRNPDGWTGALTRLAEEKVISREALLDGCVSRLLRGDRLPDVRGFLKLLDALEPTEDEHAARAVTWVRMLPDAHSTVAGRAQQVLGALDAAGRLGTGHLVEASRAVLFRPEKGLVRAQLILLDKAVRRDRSRAGELLLAAADAFGHEDNGLQERALALVARHLRHAGGTVAGELAASAGLLGPGLRARAAEIFGTAAVPDDAFSEEPGAETLPPVPEPVRLDPEVPSLAEVVEEVGALLGRAGTVGEFERAFNGLVVHAHRDRTALAEALEPVSRRFAWLDAPAHGRLQVHGLAVVVRAVRGTARHRLLRLTHASIAKNSARTRVFRSVVDTRLVEAALRLLTDPLPFLLALPTRSDGVIDPAVLVERVRAYEEAGVQPGQADFDQALLRVGGGAGPGVLGAADRLTSPPGRRLAAWLARGGLPAVVSSYETSPPAPESRNRWSGRNAGRRICIRTGTLPGVHDFPRPFRLLFDLGDPFAEDASAWWQEAAGSHAVAVMPHSRETVAAFSLPRIAATADEDERADGTVLPALAEAGGEAGPAVHLALAYGLGARFAEDRLSAVDALLVMAARGCLDTARLGRDSADLVSLGALKPQRLASSLQEAARTGARTTTWAVLAAALPVLLERCPSRGLSALVALAADCAEHSAAKGEIPQVTAVAEHGGSAQVIKQARRLRDQLARG